MTKRPIRKLELTENQVHTILLSTHTIGILASMIKVEHQIKVFDTKFKLASTNNHANRIIESANQISIDTAFQFKLKDRDDLTYNHGVQYHRLLSHFIALGIERTTEFMDQVDAVQPDPNSKRSIENFLLDEFNQSI